MSEDAISFPLWFETEFAALNGEDRAEVEQLWRDEPALRTLVLLLDSVHPDNLKYRSCPYCGNTHLSWRRKPRGSGEAKCRGCGKTIQSSTGTPFQRLLPANYMRLYRVAVVMWGPWTPWYAWRIAGLPECKALRPFMRRLAPLLAELEELVTVSRPRYRLGFTPAQQGVRCIRCQGDRLVYRKRYDPDDPEYHCAECNYLFRLNRSRRMNLPLPEGLVCPDCRGVHLIRKCTDSLGRCRYHCKSCKRTFVERPKKYQPSKRARRASLPSPADAKASASQATIISTHQP